MNKIFWALWLSMAATTPLAAQNGDMTQIQDLLDKQVICWNEADLECFMEAYWKSDSLMYISSKGVIYGWGNTLRRYRETYPVSQAMGELELNVLHTRHLGPDNLYMVGRYYLRREKEGELSGYFTLIWRRIEGRWRIVSDHSS